MTVVTACPVKRMPWALWVLVAGCGGFRTVADADGGSDAAGNFATGPGPWGALPTGYCCTDDAQCRYRDCRTIGPARMCSDVCETDDSCAAHPGFHCVGADQTHAGHCEPVVPGAACTPQVQFQRGSKPLGACCTAGHDGRTGLDCEGGLCYGFGAVSNPYICVNQCSQAKDCPGNYMCNPIERGAVCWPLADPYTCN